MDLPEAIQLTLLLSGGQQQFLDIESKDPLLEELYKVLLDLEGKRTKQLFQIPIQQGQAVLTFPCDRLVGLISDPPILLEYHPDPAFAAQPSDRSTAKDDKIDPLISQFLQIDGFLTPSDNQRLLDFVAQQQSDFVSTSTSVGDLDYRKSVVLHSFPEFSNLITQRIRETFPDILSKLNLPDFAIQQIESQLTAHNDGHYYNIHNDNGSPDSETRELTYVYYFHNQPKAFSGGELKIYDTRIKNNYYVDAETFHIIEPRNNSIVFFLSRYMHEVLPIYCASRAFADSRFTINGWIRR
jgi:Rps23 Pro-64 3,4-dihydroxylase Tpa1-like proline 4-hydroxylase